jgi:hypothetical protein
VGLRPSFIPKNKNKNKKERKKLNISITQNEESNRNIFIKVVSNIVFAVHNSYKIEAMTK